MPSEYRRGPHTSVHNTPLPATSGQKRPLPWQSWGSTVRYVVVRLAEAVPYVVLAWQAYLRR
jgi:hypothetical protein